MTALGYDLLAKKVSTAMPMPMPMTTAGGLGCGVAPCPEEGDVQLGEFVDGSACGGGEVPCDLVADQ